MVDIFFLEVRLETRASNDIFTWNIYEMQTVDQDQAEYFLKSDLDVHLPQRQLMLWKLAKELTGFQVNHCAEQLPDSVNTRKMELADVVSSISWEGRFLPRLLDFFGWWNEFLSV